jgi:hypothetical protein
MPTFESLSSSSVSDQTRNLAERKNYEEESRNHDRKSQQKGDITTTGKNHKGEREKSVLSAVCCISNCSAGCENWLRGSRFQAEDVFVRRRARAIVSTCTMPAGVGTQESAHAHRPSVGKNYSSYSSYSRVVLSRVE